MQTEELSYAIITPYSMRKSRTGGIIARLISRTGLDLVAARMFAPSEDLVRRYAEKIVSETEPAHRATQELIHQYVLKNFGAKKDRQQSRVLFLVFRGLDAAERMRATVGHITHEETSGETIRDTFGDYVTDDSGKVVYFEPAVVAEFNPKAIERDLKLWAGFSDSDGGVLDQAVQFPKDAKNLDTTKDATRGKMSSNLWRARARATRFRKSATRLAPKNVSPWFIKAKTQSAKFARCSARLIRQKRRQGRFEKNLARLL